MKKLIISEVSVNDAFVSIFSEATHEQNARGGMLLTDRIDALNFRIRESAPGYQADWHVAGDPTLLLIQQGTLRITLRDGSYRDFSAGDMCIAKDYLPKDVPFDTARHGHQASVVGETDLKAVHIKLGTVNDSR